MYEKIYISNYTPKYMQAFTYSFFFWFIELHVAACRPNFAKISLTKFEVQQLCYAIHFSSKQRVCLVGHCWLCRVYIPANETTVPLLCHEPPKQHNVQTQYIAFQVLQFPMQICSKYFSLRLYLPSYGSNNYRNICRSSSYMSVILSDNSRNCNSWANFLVVSNLKFPVQPNCGFSRYCFCSEGQTDKPV